MHTLLLIKHEHLFVGGDRVMSGENLECNKGA